MINKLWTLIIITLVKWDKMCFPTICNQGRLHTHPHLPTATSRLPSINSHFHSLTALTVAHMHRRFCRSVTGAPHHFMHWIMCYTVAIMELGPEPVPRTDAGARILSEEHFQGQVPLSRRCGTWSHECSDTVH